MLALVDAQHIDAAFNHLKSRAGEFTGDGFEKLADFLAYVEKVCSSVIAVARCNFFSLDVDQSRASKWNCLASNHPENTMESGRVGQDW